MAIVKSARDSSNCSLLLAAATAVTAGTAAALPRLSLCFQLPDRPVRQLTNSRPALLRRQYSAAIQQLSKDAAYAPQVNLCAILCMREQLRERATQHTQLVRA
eukprot:16287-Heterococcus_DN1.PRE.3